MQIKLLDVLVCPECKGDLLIGSCSQESDEILNGSLQCKECVLSFPIIEGIPNMIPRDISFDKQKTSNFFEKDWRIFDTNNKRFEELLPLYISPLTLSSFKDKFILEAGCGSGRNLIMAAKAGAKEVIGFDISGSVKIAYEKTKNFPNIHIVRADILKPPFKSIFDIIFSVGVLHHLPNPEEGFLELVNYLKKGGIIAISVYSKENNEWIIKFLNPLRKKILCKMPDTFSLFIAFLAAGLTYPVMRLYRIVNENALTKHWAKEHMFYNDFLYLLSQLGFKLVWGQFWDQLTAPTAFYVSKNEMEKWYERAGLDNVSLEWRNKNCWNGIGIK